MIFLDECFCLHLKYILLTEFKHRYYSFKYSKCTFLAYEVHVTDISYLTLSVQVEVTSPADPSTYVFKLQDFNHHFYIDEKSKCYKVKINIISLNAREHLYFMFLQNVLSTCEKINIPLIWQIFNFD